MQRGKKGLTFFVQFNGLESGSELLKQLFDTHAERTIRFAAINININIVIKIKSKLYNRQYRKERDLKTTTESEETISLALGNAISVSSWSLI